VLASPLFAQEVSFSINAARERHTIPAAVYGVNGRGYTGATVNRHGGNRHTGLNWENNASNAGSDYLHSSDSYLGDIAGIGATRAPGALLKAWVDADRATGLKTILTLPLAGFVAADMNGPVAATETAPSPRWKKIVVDKSGALSLTPNLDDGVVYLEEMVNYIITSFGTTAAGGIAAYSLDNEPALWSGTHPRIHPKPASYEEIVSRHTAAAKMVTRLDASAQIYGPVLYGWNAHLNLQGAPDAPRLNKTFGNFTNYYLAQMKAASGAAGRRLLHRFDMHWYPEARGDHRICIENTSPPQGTDHDIDARLQAPRSLWDPDYVENSWITQKSTGGKAVRLLSQLREAINQYFPGTGLAITEYNYGAPEHISGGVAHADVLGIFGRYQVAACFWPLSSENSYIKAAFQIYRNYDGAGATFGDVSLDATVSDNSKAAVHAARSFSGGPKITVIAINRSRTQDQNGVFEFTFPGGQTIASVKAYRLDEAGGASVQAVSLAPEFSSAAFSHPLPAMSVTLYEVQIGSSATAPPVP
jgi:mannan endo-1,4-beta-mannosidase